MPLLHKGPLGEKSYQLARLSLRIGRRLEKEAREFNISRQLIRSGTAPGALVREAQSAESRPDFIHKLSIALKETDETLLWIHLLHDEALLSLDDFQELERLAGEVFALLTSIIRSTKRSQV